MGMDKKENLVMCSSYQISDESVGSMIDNTLCNCCRRYSCGGIMKRELF